MKVAYLFLTQERMNFNARMKWYGIPEIDWVYIDGDFDRERPQLKELMNFVKPGDTIFMEELGDVADSADELLVFLQEIQRRKLKLVVERLPEELLIRE